MALVLGTNMGFVTVSPSADPEMMGVAVDGFARAQQFTSPSGNNTITEMGWYQDSFPGDPGESWDIGIYDDDTGVPGNLLFHTTGTVGAAPGWNVSGTLDWEIDASTTYWLAVVCEDSTPATDISYATSGHTYSLDIRGEGTLADPWVQTSSGAYGFALYAKYEAPVTYVELSGTIAAMSVVEDANLEINTSIALSGTIAATSVVGSASLGQTTVSLAESNITKRLIAIGNDRFYYEDI